MVIHKKIDKKIIIHIVIFIMIITLFFVLMKAGYNYFASIENNNDPSLLQQQSRIDDSLVREEFFQKYQTFCHALGNYFTTGPFWFGLMVVGLMYCWMIFHLFYRYFNLFKSIRYLDILLNPWALESIPHCLVVLVVYFVFFSSSALNAVLMAVYVIISLPFVYKILEDVFSTAEREGTVEIYLNKRKSDLALVFEFIKKRVVRLFAIPIVFLVMLMAYWDFLYASIAISGDEAAAPAVFYSNFNNAFFVNYPERHNALILFHVGLFAIMMFAILYFISIAGSSKND